MLDRMSSLDAGEFRIALLIGQQDYKDEKFEKLHYCHRDIEEVRLMLYMSCGFNIVRPFKNAVNNDGHNDFLTLQKWLVQEIKPAKRVLVLVYYAGHAVSIAGQSYFIPVDAKIGEVGKYINVYSFLQPLHDLISEINHSCARRTAAELSAEPVPGAVGLLFLDGCRDGEGISRTPLPAEEALLEGSEISTTPLPAEEAILEGSEASQAESGALCDMQDMVHRLASSRTKGTNSQFCVFFACDEGSGAGECEITGHGFFTEAFLHCVEAYPGIGLPDLFEKIAERCQKRSNFLQRPWIYSCCHSLKGIVLRQHSRPKAGCLDPAISRGAIERSCPDSGLFLETLKSCVGDIEDIAKAGQLRESEELQTKLELAQAVVSRLLQPEWGLSQEAMSLAVALLRGLQCLLPKHRAVAALLTRVRACAWQDAARRLSSETAVASDVQRGIDEGKELLDQMSVTVVVVGPTSSGKSTAVNALFGCKVCPMGNTPQSILPVVFTANASATSFQVVPRGCGLRDCLVDQLEGIELQNLTSDKAHALINSCDAELRRLISDGRLCPQSLSDFASWHMEVLVPAPNTMKCFSIVDCPGGSEGGKLGSAASQLLQYQTREASLILLDPWF